jgi:hypothetical protein
MKKKIYKMEYKLSTGYDIEKSKQTTESAKEFPNVREPSRYREGDKCH